MSKAGDKASQIAGAVGLKAVRLGRAYYIPEQKEVKCSQSLVSDGER